MSTSETRYASSRRHVRAVVRQSARALVQVSRGSPRVGGAAVLLDGASLREGARVVEARREVRRHLRRRQRLAVHREHVHRAAPRQPLHLRPADAQHDPSTCPVAARRSKWSNALLKARQLASPGARRRRGRRSARCAPSGAAEGAGPLFVRAAGVPLQEVRAATRRSFRCCLREEEEEAAESVGDARHPGATTQLEQPPLLRSPLEPPAEIPKVQHARAARGIRSLRLAAASSASSLAW